MKKNRLEALKTHEFTKVLRGYSPQEVDEIFREFLGGMDSLFEKIEEYERDKESLRKKQSSLESTLVSAREAADGWMEAAKTEAAKLTILSQTESQALLEKAQRESDQILEKARNESALILEKAKEEAEAKQREIQKSILPLVNTRKQMVENIARMISLTRGEMSGVGEAMTRWEKILTDFENLSKSESQKTSVISIPSGESLLAIGSKKEIPQ